MVIGGEMRYDVVRSVVRCGTIRYGQVGLGSVWYGQRTGEVRRGSEWSGEVRSEVRIGWVG